MSRAIDLLPASCRARLRTRDSARRWTIAYVAVGSAVALASAAAYLAAAAKHAELARAEAQARVDATIAKSLADVNVEAGRLAETLRRYAEQEIPVPLTCVLASLAAAAPENTSLISLSITPVFDRTTRTASRFPRALLIECSGVAPDDLEIATLVAGLENDPLFGRVAIEHVRPAGAPGAEHRRFGLTAEIDLTSRRMIPPVETADAGKGGKP